MEEELTRTPLWRHYLRVPGDERAHQRQELEQAIAALLGDGLAAAGSSASDVINTMRERTYHFAWLEVREARLDDEIRERRLASAANELAKQYEQPRFTYHLGLARKLAAEDPVPLEHDDHLVNKLVAWQLCRWDLSDCHPANDSVLAEVGKRVARVREQWTLEPWRARSQRRSTMTDDGIIVPSSRAAAWGAIAAIEKITCEPFTYTTHATEKKGRSGAKAPGGKKMLAVQAFVAWCVGNLSTEALAEYIDDWRHPETFGFAFAITETARGDKIEISGGLVPLPDTGGGYHEASAPPVFDAAGMVLCPYHLPGQRIVCTDPLICAGGRDCWLTRAKRSGYIWNHRARRRAAAKAKSSRKSKN